MALTRELELPPEPRRGTSWSITRLFGTGVDGVGVAIKQHRPMEFAFLFMVIASFILELFRSTPSWEWWVIMAFVFVAAFMQRLALPETVEPKTSKKEAEEQSK